MFAVPAGKGKLEKILKKIFEFSAVPSRRAELKNYSQRNSFEPFAPSLLIVLEQQMQHDRSPRTGEYKTAYLTKDVREFLIIFLKRSSLYHENSP